MRKLLTAVSFAALALGAVTMGVAQTNNVQLAGVSTDFPTNIQEDDVTIRLIGDLAGIRYDFPTNAQEDDVTSRLIGDLADVRYDFPQPEGDSDDSFRRSFPGDSKA